eukprot:4654982-Amphidinium_carterae.1
MSGAVAYASANAGSSALCPSAVTLLGHPVFPIGSWVDGNESCGCLSTIFVCIMWPTREKEKFKSPKST